MLLEAFVLTATFSILFHLLVTKPCWQMTLLQRPLPPPQWQPCGGDLPWEQGQLAEGPLAPGGRASRGGHPWLPAALALALGRMQSRAGGAAPFSGCRQAPTHPGPPRVSEGSGNSHGSCSELRTPSPGSMGTSAKEERGHQRTRDRSRERRRAREEPAGLTTPPPQGTRSRRPFSARSAFKVRGL